MTLGFEMQEDDAVPEKKPAVRRTRKKPVTDVWEIEALLNIGRGCYLLLSQLNNPPSAPLVVAASSAKVAASLQVQCGVQTPALFAQAASAETEAGNTAQVVCVLSDVSEEARPVQLVMALQGGERLSATQAPLELRPDNTEALRGLLERFTEPLKSMMRHEKTGASPVKDFLRVFETYAASLKKPVQGAFERIDENGLAHGWALNRLNPKQRVQVGVYEGKRLVGWATTQLERPALKAAQKSGAKPGFEIRLSPQVFDGKPHLLNAFVMGTEQALAGGPLAFQSALVKPVPDAGILGYDKSVSLMAASAIGVAPDDAAKQAEMQAQMAIVCVLMELGSHELALKLLEKWSEQGQCKSLLEFKIAECEMLLKKDEAASKRFAAMVKANPETVWGWWGLGEVFFRTGKFKDASKCFSEANRRQPNIPGVLKRAAQLRLKVARQNGVASLSRQQAIALLGECRKMVLIDTGDTEVTELLFDLTLAGDNKKAPIKQFKDHLPETRALIHERLVLETLCEFLGNPTAGMKPTGSNT